MTSEAWNYAQAGGGGVLTSAAALLDREDDLARVLNLLSDDLTRLLTLLGPGGVGKTRLALAVAAVLEESGEDSVFVVYAADLVSTTQLMAEISRELGLRDEPGMSPEEIATRALRKQGALLVLDNVEQIPGVGKLLGVLLSACPALTILATSRTPVRLRGERRLVIEPLEVDSFGVGVLSPALLLFEQRAQEVTSNFEINDDNRETVTAICTRLDGLPLAIELAASRIRTLSPAALLARLTNQLIVLASGATDLPERHRTMHTAIAWSYDLLDESTRAGYRKLSLIPSSFGLNLASAVCETSEDETLTLIEELLDQSLLVQDRESIGEPRFRMLQTIRDFGREKAELAGETEPVEIAIANYVVTKSTEFRAGLSGPMRSIGEINATKIIQPFSFALDALIRKGDAANAVKVAGSLWRYWYGAGRYREGIDSLAKALAVPGDSEAAELANAFNGLGALNYGTGNLSDAAEAFRQAEPLWLTAEDRVGLASTMNNVSLVLRDQGDYAGAITALERVIGVLEELGDQRRLALSQDNLGLVLSELGDNIKAGQLHAKALATSRELGDEEMMATASHHLAGIMLDAEDFRQAGELSELAREIWERHGDRSQLGYALNTLGNVANGLGDVPSALRRYAEALTCWRELNQPKGIALALQNLGTQAVEGGEPAKALGFFRESLDIRRRLGNPQDLVYSLNGFAGVAVFVKDFDRATRLLAAASALRERSGLESNVNDRGADLRAVMGNARFELEWNVGAAMDFDAALADTEFISAIPREQTATTKKSATAVATIPREPNHGLTARELDVLRLIASGKTNAEIGESLFISPFTAKTHVANLLGKLAVENRAAAATWAAQHSFL